MDSERSQQIKFHKYPSSRSHTEIHGQDGRLMDVMKVTNALYDYANVPNYGTPYRERMDQRQGTPLSQDKVVRPIL